MAPKRAANGEAKNGSKTESSNGSKNGSSNGGAKNGQNAKNGQHAKNGEQKEKRPERHILVTSAEGQTGRLVVELLLTDDSYASKFTSLSPLVFSDDAKASLDEFMAGMEPGLKEVLVYDPQDEAALVKSMEAVDTCLLIPPARKDKAKITRTLLEVAKKAKSVQNLVFLSSAGCDYAERDSQPRLREFVDLEVLAMAPKGLPETERTGHSPCIIRAGFYAENLLLYAKQAQGEGKLPIPIGKNHKFAPIALGDVAQLCAHVLTSYGEHGLDDNVRGQMIVATGAGMFAGEEIAEAASQALGTKMEFQPISEEQAKKILASDQGDEVDEAEKEYLLEYYSLVREGKTNYTSNIAFQKIFGHRGQEISDFFKVYEDSFKPKKRRVATTSKTSNSNSKPKSSSKAATEDVADVAETRSRSAKSKANSKLESTFDEEMEEAIDEQIMAPEVEAENA